MSVATKIVSGTRYNNMVWPMHSSTPSTMRTVEIVPMRGLVLETGSRSLRDIDKRLQYCGAVPENSHGQHWKMATYRATLFSGDSGFVKKK